MTEMLTQTQLARRLGRDPARIREFVAKGVLKPVGEGRAARFEWAAALEAFVDYQVRRQAQRLAEELAADIAGVPASLADAELRKARADAIRAEVRAKRELGEVIAVTDAVAEGRRFAEQVRALLLAVPSRYQAAVASELRVPIPAAGVALRTLVGEVLADLQRDAGQNHEAAA